GKPYVRTNWAKEIGPDGRPLVLDNVGSADNCLPDSRGGTLFQPPSYDPVRRLFFVTARETCASYVSIQPTTITLGAQTPSGGARRIGRGEQFSALRAIDPTSGETKWEHRFPGYPGDVILDDSGGATSTASGVVF